MNYYRNEEETHTLPMKKIVLSSVIGILVIVFLCCIGSLVEDVDNEDIVVNQVPITGTMELKNILLFLIKYE